ncbi:hypothetical protein [Kitasatospora sp. NPDC002965]|uniref:hypothetical protein n=1 Tax=Kitasatospora sp. NPDC002965 TaxID=3154775 RepID=UPI0033A410CA
MAKQKIFEYPPDLLDAQRALSAVRAERSAYLRALPRWADLPAGEFLSAEQYAESDRLTAAERDAAQVVDSHPFWTALPAGDRVAARTQLQHTAPAEAALDNRGEA